MTDRVIKNSYKENGKLYLELEYEVKDKVKFYNARWSSEYKMWYITNLSKLNSILKIKHGGTECVTVPRYFMNPDVDISDITKEDMNLIRKGDYSDEKLQKMIDEYNEKKMEEQNKVSFSLFFK